MLDKLTIKNFRIFEDFHVEGLQRVNLIAGKNNTGKTVLLEALRIWAAKGDSTVVNHSLNQRRQFRPSWDSSYDAMFNRKNFKKDANNTLVINELLIRKVKVRQGGMVYESIFRDKPTVAPSPPPNVLRVGGGSKKTNNPNELSSQSSYEFPKDEAIFVPFGGMYQRLQELWDRVTLTDFEDDVTDIIRQTVEPRLKRVDVSNDQARVRLAGEAEPLPIQSLGDGVQRMLLLALSLVNAKGKLLLIDEFDIGLHHSVQEKLWNMVFLYCQKWDIQAFITTHSDDAIRTFFLEAAKPENKEDAFFFRLQFDRQGKLEAIPYDLDRLEHALEQQIEIR